MAWPLENDGPDSKHEDQPHAQWRAAAGMAATAREPRLTRRANQGYVAIFEKSE
jgi:hypothetical protein